MTSLNPHNPSPARRAQPSAGAEASRFFNRDVSWLEFNRRVLAQVTDTRLPLLDRVRFLVIFSNNLDEFFMKRLGLIRRQIHAGAETPGPDGLTPRQQLAAVRASVQQLSAEAAAAYEQELVPALAKNGITLHRYSDLTPRERRALDEWFRANVFPSLTPLAVDPGHRFPFISNLSVNLAILAQHPSKPDDETIEFARLKIPDRLARFVPVPAVGPRPAGSVPAGFIHLGEIIRANLGLLFPGMKVRACEDFRVTRSAGIQRDEVTSDNLLTSVEADLKERRFARAVRLETAPNPSPAILHLLLDKLRLDPQDLYASSGLVDYGALAEIADLDRPDLNTVPWKPAIPPRLGDPKANIFSVLRKQDVLVHHPYESFSHSVERFIAAAASDPDVITIKQTLYRTSPDSPFIESLIRAAEAGKQVACLVEVRARFDEHRNVLFARQLEKAGVHVAYGVVGLKTHSKVSLVVRKERPGLRCYAHIGTGNYNPKTAQLYTDLGLLTADPDLTGDLVNLFNYLTGLAATQSYDHLLVAPFNMRAKFNHLIERETEHARRGRPARIIAKINALEDRDLASRLYDASAAGVHVTLIVRGFCCLRPGVPGLSDNIRVLSVVGRFLEHSRIFHFAAGQDDPLDGDWFIGSADWMYRNLSNRVEAAAPVRDRDARRRLLRIVGVSIADHRHAWDLLPDGTYVQRRVPGDADPASPEALGTFGTLMLDAASP